MFKLSFSLVLNIDTPATLFKIRAVSKTEGKSGTCKTTAVQMARISILGLSYIPPVMTYTTSSRLAVEVF